VHFGPHRIILAIILGGNALAFAGVDPVTRALTAAACFFLAFDLRKLPAIPGIHRLAVAGFTGVLVLQLIPLPEAVRVLLQPGFADVLPTGWAPMSLAPWATVEAISSLIILMILALTASRIAATRSGVPVLMLLIAGTGLFSAILGLISEGADPSVVLFFRENVQGGGPYGAFVNHNHYVQLMELSLPAAFVMLAFAARRLPNPGAMRQKAAVGVLAGMVTIAVGTATMLRAGSRGGVLFFSLSLLITAPMWRRSIGGGRKWIRWVVAGLLIVTTGFLASTRLPELKERMSTLFAVEGLHGNSRIDFWSATLDSFRRAPLLGSGAGTYPFVIPMDKPATGTELLEEAHSDPLELLSTTGIVGTAFLVIFLAGMIMMLDPRKIRRLRADYRYPLAGAAVAGLATVLHECIGFGLQTPLNRYVAAIWIGLVWGMIGGMRSFRSQREDPGESR